MSSSGRAWQSQSTSWSWAQRLHGPQVEPRYWSVLLEFLFQLLDENHESFTFAMQRRHVVGQLDEAG